MGGLILTHYRIAVFVLIFIASYLILNLRDREKGGAASGGITRGALLWKSAALVGASLLAAAPWLLNLGSGSLLEIATRLLTTLPGQGSPFSKEYNAFSNPLNFLPAWAWFGMLLSAGWGLWQRQRSIALMDLWWFLVFVATNPQMLALPGAGMITNFTLLAATYIPASLLIGATGAGLVEKARLPMQAQSKLPLALALFIVLAALFGARQRLDDIQPLQHALVTHPDLRASAWIASHLPSDAHVLVNAFLAFGGSNVVGSDGGWWLPLFSRRQTMLPPLNYGSEKGSRPDYQAWANALVTEIQAKGIDHPDVINLLEQRGIDYLYIGQRHGVVNSPGPLLPLEQNSEQPEFQAHLSPGSGLDF